MEEELKKDPFLTKESEGNLPFDFSSISVLYLSGEDRVTQDQFGNFRMLFSLLS